MLPLISTSVAMAVGGTQCGTKICEMYQFCSKFHNDCEECAPLCDESGHNYDGETCKNECRDYLHDKSYVKLSDYAAEIKNLKIYLTITFLLVLLVLICFFAINGKRIYIWLQNIAVSMKKQEKKQKHAEPVTLIQNPNTESPKLRKNNINNQQNLNRTSSIFTVSGTEYDQKTVSTPISRHPAEDTLSNSVTTIDYSYDNKALQLTPVVEKPKTETNF